MTDDIELMPKTYKIVIRVRSRPHARLPTVMESERFSYIISVQLNVYKYLSAWYILYTIYDIPNILMHKVIRIEYLRLCWIYYYYSVVFREPV